MINKIFCDIIIFTFLKKANHENSLSCNTETKLNFN